MAEYTELRDACKLDGFIDDEQTQRVSRWALAEIDRLCEALRSVGPCGECACEEIARDALGGEKDSDGA